MIKKYIFIINIINDVRKTESNKRRLFFYTKTDEYKYFEKKYQRATKENITTTSTTQVEAWGRNPKPDKNGCKISMTSVKTNYIYFCKETILMNDNIIVFEDLYDLNKIKQIVIVICFFVVFFHMNQTIMGIDWFCFMSFL